MYGFVEELEISDPRFRLQRAFDNIYYTFWETNTKGRPGFVYSPMKRTKLSCYGFKSGADKEHKRMPMDWEVFGRKSKALDWVKLDRVIDEKEWSDNELRSYQISNPDLYENYKFSFINSHADNYLRIYEVKFSEKLDCAEPYP